VVQADLYQRGASYMDRVRKGAKPADRPVQLPTKYELVVNLPPWALGLTIPHRSAVECDIRKLDAQRRRRTRAHPDGDAGLL
jgi:hypothetical protein